LAVANAGLLAAPAIHTIATPVVQAAPVHTVVHTAHALPLTYATTYKYRAVPAKIAVASHPVVVAAPQPLYKTVVPVHTSYASSYSYRLVI